MKTDKIPIVNSNCISCTLCEGYCSEVFILETWVSTVKEKVDYWKYRRQINDSIEICPVNAISWKEKRKRYKYILYLF